MRLLEYKILLFFFFLLLFGYVVLGSRLVHFKDYSELKAGLLIKDHINTGDVFLLSYNNVFRSFGESFMGVRFFHPSIAMWQDGELYMIEYAEYNKPYDGINKIPFEIWYRINKNSMFLHNHLDFKGDYDLGEKLEAYYQKYKNMKVVDQLAWIRLMLQQDKKYIPKNEKEDTLICTEFAANFFTDLGVVKNLKSLPKYEPEDFVGMKGFVLTKDFDYSDGYIADMSFIDY